MSSIDSSLSSSRAAISVIRVIVGGLLAIVFGIVGFSFVFSDLAPGEAAMLRSVLTWGWFLVSGLIVAVVSGRRFWALSVVSAWVTSLVGVFRLTHGWETGVFLEMVIQPIFFSLVGGLLGLALLHTIANRMRFR